MLAIPRSRACWGMTFMFVVLLLLILILAAYYVSKSMSSLQWPPLHTGDEFIEAKEALESDEQTSTEFIFGLTD